MNPTCFNINARSIMISVEFYRVDTSGISSSDSISAAMHCCLNFSQRCGDARIFTITLRSFNFNKISQLLQIFNNDLHNILPYI